MPVNSRPGDEYMHQENMISLDQKGFSFVQPFFERMSIQRSSIKIKIKTLIIQGNTFEIVYIIAAFMCRPQWDN